MALSFRLSAVPLIPPSLSPWAACPRRRRPYPRASPGPRLAHHRYWIWGSLRPRRAMLAMGRQLGSRRRRINPRRRPRRGELAASWILNSDKLAGSGRRTQCWSRRSVGATSHEGAPCPGRRFRSGDRDSGRRLRNSGTYVHVRPPSWLIERARGVKDFGGRDDFLIG